MIESQLVKRKAWGNVKSEYGKRQVRRVGPREVKCKTRSASEIKRMQI